MESNCTNCNENVYFACRKKAASYNEKLNSRESAAELLGISPSTLANHELGITKSVPVDTVVMMADLYHAPELKNMHRQKSRYLLEAFRRAIWKIFVSSRNSSTDSHP